MASRDTKKNITMALFEHLCSYIDSGEINRLEALEVAGALKDGVTYANNQVVDKGFGEFLEEYADPDDNGEQA